MKERAICLAMPGGEVGDRLAIVDPLNERKTCQIEGCIEADVID